MEILPFLVSWFVWLIYAAIIIRGICWLIGMFVPPLNDNIITRISASITEPIIAPFRGLTPEINGFDLFSFFFAMASLRIVSVLVESLSR